MVEIEIGACAVKVDRRDPHPGYSNPNRAWSDSEPHLSTASKNWMFHHEKRRTKNGHAYRKIAVTQTQQRVHNYSEY